jgi:hypothetical protein
VALRLTLGLPKMFRINESNQLIWDEEIIRKALNHPGS